MIYTITFISVSDGGLRYLKESFDSLLSDTSFGDRLKEQVRINLYYIGGQKDHAEKLKELEKVIPDSQIVFIDLMGADRQISAGLEKITEHYQGDLILPGSGSEVMRSRLKIGSFSMAGMQKMRGQNEKGRMNRQKPVDMQKMINRMETVGKLMPVGILKDMRNWILLGKLWRYAGPANCRTLLLLLFRDYAKIKKLPRPDELLDYSRYVLFDPNKLRGFKNMTVLKKIFGWDSSKKTVGLLFYNHNYPNDTYEILSRLCDLLKRTYNVVPLGIGTDTEKYKKIRALFAQGLKLDLLWNFLPFRFGAGPMGGDTESGLAIFREMDVPVMHPFFIGRHKIKEWKDDLMSLNPMQVIIHFMLPEQDGVIDTIPIAAMRETPEVGVEDLQELQIIDKRLDKVLAKTDHYINLGTKPNSEKRVAFVMYNYPPGEANVGGGSFLDTFCSMEAMTSQMKAEGYSCESFSARELEEVFMNSGACNTPGWHDTNAITCRYQTEKHTAHQQKLNDSKMIDRISGEWGEPPGEIMTDKAEFLLPGIIKENVFVGLQPGRGTFENPEKLYHDKELPPHHQYLAFYSYLEHEFKADVVIHVGTHGSIEFLPGKENALSDDCFPDYFIGTMPHLYLYYVGNPSEATIAKRRTHGCMITYSGPAFMRSGSYGDYVELENIIHEYEEAREIAPQKRASLFDKIIAKATEMQLITDNDPTPDTISAELIRLKSELVPKGLHIIGKPFDQQELASFLSGILSWNRGEVVSLKSIFETEDSILPDNIGKSDIAKQDYLYTFIEELVFDYYFGPKTLFDSCLKKLSSTKKRDLKTALAFGDSCLEKIAATDETRGLLNGLNAGYVEARLGGDIIRDPEVYPTGHNIFQFDARMVPSDTAMERGKEIAEGNIAYYLKEKGVYPTSVTVVLWGLETSRTKGETLGQVMGLMGVKLAKSHDSWTKTFEIIPLEELGRPRIDCLTTICGFFRDMFPNLIEFLDEIYETVSMLDESPDDNYVLKNRKAIFEELKKEIDEETAHLLSRARIFGPPEGQYGTGITTMIENKNWQDEFEIADAYISSQKHIYGREKRGEVQQEVFEQNLKRVDIVSQVRSSVDYSFTDLDHYYEYFGGLAKSVEKLKGEKPVMLVSDSSTSQIFTDEAKKAIELGVRSRLLNPEYIKELLKHKVHGAQHLAKRVENLIGLAATTGRVDSWVFNAVKERFIDDKETFNQLKANNRFSAGEIIGRLLEAKERGYYDISEEELDKLKETYLELEGDMEDNSESSSFPQ